MRTLAATAIITATVITAYAAEPFSPITTLLPTQQSRTWIYNYTPAPAAVQTPVLEPEEAVEGIDAFFDDEIEPHTEFYSLIDSMPLENVVTVTRLRPYQTRPVVFDKLRIFPDTLSLSMPPAVEPGVVDPWTFEWINEEALRTELLTRARQAYFVNHPDMVIYNESHLPEPPKEYTATIDPETASVVFKEVIALEAPKTVLETEYDRKHWLRKFTADLQFSQAYVSPNWYQGGKNNLNALLNLFYEVKLNKAFHPKWIFDNTFQYKLGLNDAPDDKLHDYNITDDIFQWNMTAGYKSTKRWYYSVSALFKTQLFNNYKPNTDQLKAAFLSPGELNVGVGMTYSYANKKKTVNFDASISPISWNMKTCTHSRMDETSFGIKEGRKVVNEIGSSAEGKLTWKICDNISLRSRLFVFTDYDYIQSDWENTLQFTINRFLSTQIYVHARYDSTTKRPDEFTEWHKLQLKEILSFGFSYKFGNL
ncbi:MAG: DUF3078 domain-containing protein [Muribaculaceae bacterium]|nr:DUF3078 domain-containing protein [Muribaculaceae bacterium]